MTVRSVIIGLLISVALASFGYINDTWLFLSYIGGDLVPTHAYGLLLIGLLLINPLLHWSRRLRFRASEWVVILSMSFMGSVLAGSGLFWQYPHPLINPIRAQNSNPDWKSRNLLQYAPDVMLVDAKNDPDGPVVDKYFKGSGDEPTRVPWSAWRRTLTFWFGFGSLSFIAGICSAVIVHRQWSKREHLSYPIVTFANELITSEPNRPFNPIFRQWPFWIGMGISLFVLMTNALKTWIPEVPAVPTSVDCSGLRQLQVLGPLMKVPGAPELLNVRFYFAAVGLAFFLSSEASFSLGISGWLYALAATPLVARGVDLSTTLLGGGLPSYAYFGAYLGMGLTVLYLGRRFYWAVLKRAAFVPDRRADVLGREAWAARIGMLACILMVGMLWKIGLHPALGIAFSVLTILLFLIIGRVNAATGLFLIQPFWNPVVILVGLLGTIALGPKTLMILALLTTFVAVDTRIAAVPLVLNALRLSDEQKVRPGRMAGWMSAAMVLSLVIGMCFTVWLMYDLGVDEMSSGGTRWALTVSKMPLQLLERNLNKLTEDQLDQATAPVTLAKLAGGRSAKSFFTAMGIGLVLVFGCSLLRLRFTRWPLHPVMFLVWGTHWMTIYAPSFLLAWGLKSVILKYGGRGSYSRARSLFVGLVAGEFAAAMIVAVIAVIYRIEVGDALKTFLTRE